MNKFIASNVTDEKDKKNVKNMLNQMKNDRERKGVRLCIMNSHVVVNCSVCTHKKTFYLKK